MVVQLVVFTSIGLFHSDAVTSFFFFSPIALSTAKSCGLPFFLFLFLSVAFYFFFFLQSDLCWIFFLPVHKTLQRFVVIVAIFLDFEFVLLLCVCVENHFL